MAAAPKSARFLYGEATYLIDAADVAAVRDIVARRKNGLLDNIVGGFGAVMYYLIQGEIRHDEQIFEHKNGDCYDFTRNNLKATTRRVRCYPQLALRPRPAGSLLPQQGVISNGRLSRVAFRTPGGKITLGDYWRKENAWAVYQAYQQGTLSIARRHQDEQQRGLPLSNVTRTSLLKELGLFDPPLSRHPHNCIQEQEEQFQVQCSLSIGTAKLGSYRHRHTAEGVLYAYLRGEVKLAAQHLEEHRNNQPLSPGNPLHLLEELGLQDCPEHPETLFS